MPDAPNRIRELRKYHGLTLDQVAEVARTSAQQIQRLEAGSRRLTDEWMRRIAPAFSGCEPSHLLAEHDKEADAEGPEAVRPNVIYAPLIAWSVAARLHEPDRRLEISDTKDFVPVRYQRKTLFALAVETSGMNRIAPEGSFVVCDYRDRVLKDGRFYIVKLHGLTTLLRFRKDPDRFEPYSTEPDHDTRFVDETTDVIGRVVYVAHEV